MMARGGRRKHFPVAERSVNSARQGGRANPEALKVEGADPLAPARVPGGALPEWGQGFRGSVSLRKHLATHRL